MITIRKGNERGDADHEWLHSKHSFSFAGYYDAKFMGFSVLRVINEDRIRGGTGFSTHSHRDMEIISYVMEGALEHKDSMGTDTVIRPGEVQRMSAGTGVSHSEFNHFKDQETHFLQIWILPEKIGVKPGYDQKSFTADFSSSDLVLVASKDGRNGSITINQDVNMYACKSQGKGEKVLCNLQKRNLWVQVVKGEVRVESEQLQAGDGAGIQKVDSLTLRWDKGAEFIVFDLP